MDRKLARMKQDGLRVISATKRTSLFPETLGRCLPGELVGTTAEQRLWPKMLAYFEIARSLTISGKQRRETTRQLLRLAYWLQAICQFFSLPIQSRQSSEKTDVHQKEKTEVADPNNVDSDSNASQPSDTLTRHLFVKAIS